MNIFRRLWRLCRNLLRGKPRLIRASRVAEAPATLARAVLYIEGEGGSDWVAVMLCPCSCGEQISLNLLPETDPCWQIEVHADNAPSVRPSVWRTVGCRSHFFIRRGRVEWCG